MFRLTGLTQLVSLHLSRVCWDQGQDHSARLIRLPASKEGINPLEATPYFLAVDQPCHGEKQGGAVTAM